MSVEKYYSEIPSYCPTLNLLHAVYKDAYERSLEPVKRHMRSKDRNLALPHKIEVAYLKALTQLRTYLDSHGYRMPLAKYRREDMI